MNTKLFEVEVTPNKFNLMEESGEVILENLDLKFIDNSWKFHEALNAMYNRDWEITRIYLNDNKLLDKLSVEVRNKINKIRKGNNMNNQKYTTIVAVPDGGSIISFKDKNDEFHLVWILDRWFKPTKDSYYGLELFDIKSVVIKTSEDHIDYEAPKKEERVLIGRVDYIHRPDNKDIWNEDGITKLLNEYYNK